ncbi:MAG: hypothetical protein HY092_03235 [Candidatus Kerfeldbacteria bacterium]|nr:hypothetical protein [Candidatus Kerfeldbacteria bacterium]
MAINELRTSAANILHLRQPSAKELDMLREKFGLHPVDLEAALTIPKHNICGQYRDQVHLVLCWPVCPPGTGSWHFDAIHFFIGTDWLILIDHRIPSLDQTLQSVVASQPSAPPLEAVYQILHALFLDLRADIERHGFGPQPDALAKTLSDVVISIEQLIEAQGEMFRSAHDMLMAWRLLRHQILNLCQSAPQRTIASPQPARFVPTLVAGYAALSFLMIVVIRLVINRH